MNGMLTKPLLREMRNILLAAALLGAAYNSSSPLGINFPGAKPGAASGAAGLAPPPALFHQLPIPSLHNETITATVIPIGSGEGRVSETSALPVAMAWAQIKPMLAQHRIILVDARNQLSYEAGHIPGAISLPLNLLNARIPQFFSQYPKDTPLVVYCESIRCGIAQEEAIALAAKYGYQDVRVMPGGIAEWRAAGSTAVVSMQAH